MTYTCRLLRSSWYATPNLNGGGGCLNICTMWCQGVRVRHLILYAIPNPFFQFPEKCQGVVHLLIFILRIKNWSLKENQIISMFLNGCLSWFVWLWHFSLKHFIAITISPSKTNKKRNSSIKQFFLILMSSHGTTTHMRMWVLWKPLIPLHLSCGSRCTRNRFATKKQSSLLGVSQK